MLLMWQYLSESTLMQKTSILRNSIVIKKWIRPPWDTEIGWYYDCARTHNSEGHASQAEQNCGFALTKFKILLCFQSHRNYTVAYRDAMGIVSKAVNWHYLHRHGNVCWGLCLFTQHVYFKRGCFIVPSPTDGLCKTLLYKNNFVFWTRTECGFYLGHRLKMFGHPQGRAVAEGDVSYYQTQVRFWVSHTLRVW